MTCHSIGHVLGFKKYKENKLMQCKSNQVATNERDKFQVLASFHIFDENRNLIPIENQSAVDLKGYVATMKAPIVKTDEKSKTLQYILPCEYDVMETMLSDTYLH